MQPGLLGCESVPVTERSGLGGIDSLRQEGDNEEMGRRHPNQLARNNGFYVSISMKMSPPLNR